SRARRARGLRAPERPPPGARVHPGAALAAAGPLALRVPVPHLQRDPRRARVLRRQHLVRTRFLRLRVARRGALRRARGRRPGALRGARGGRDPAPPDSLAAARKPGRHRAAAGGCLTRPHRANRLAMEAAVIGAGSWGTALAIQLARAGHAVTLWARDDR